VAAAAYHTARSQCAAIAGVLADGTAEVQSGTSDMGPGTYTSMTQVAADALGMPLSRVRFALGDSRFPPAPSHSGSQTMASVGSAVFTAANMLRDRFIRIAVIDPESPLNGLRPEDVAVTDGRMFAPTGPERGESYQELLRRRGWTGLDSEQTWTPGDADKRYSMYAYGAVFAEVVVDQLLPTVRIQTRAQSGDRRHGRRHWDGPVGRDPTRPPRRPNSQCEPVRLPGSSQRRHPRAGRDLLTCRR
jgi:xanthine dehydrogenase YagR molybdenum-binding subunit